MKLSSQQIDIIKIVISSVLLAVGLIFRFENLYVSLAVYLAAFLLVGLEVVLKAVKHLFNGRVFDEKFLMTIASIGAFATNNFAEGVAVMLFFQIGELFEDFAVDKSKKSITDLMDIRPDSANVERGEEILTVSPEEVEIGEIIVIRPGEKIPLDAEIIKGSSMLDTAALTGESVPREVNEGDSILSGCINLNGLIYAKVTKSFGESTVSKILDLVENAGDKKSQSEAFITKFAKIYTPVVVIVAILLALIPPLIIKDATFSQWIYRALIFLVISCPCALVISVPLSFFGGIGAASKNGVLVKGSNYLEALAKTETVVFDKTGTLTKGIFKVQKIVPVGISKEELLFLAAYAESYSVHPISASLLAAYGKQIDKAAIGETNEISGHGIETVIDGKKVLAGNRKLMEKDGIALPQAIDETGTVVHIAADNVYLGYIVIADEVKEDSEKAISLLKQAGIKKTVMLTGDNKKIGESVASSLKIDKVYSELLPGDKVEKLEMLLTEKSENGKLVFVGDGINDAPVLARADIGVAMGGLGSDAAIEAADVVIMTDEPSKLSKAIGISKYTLKIAKQNIVFAIAVKFAILFLGAAGIASMWAAVFADVGVSVIAVVNATRVLRRYK